MTGTPVSGPHRPAGRPSTPEEEVIPPFMPTARVRVEDLVVPSVPETPVLKPSNRLSPAHAPAVSLVPPRLDPVQIPAAVAAPEVMAPARPTRPGLATPEAAPAVPSTPASAMEIPGVQPVVVVVVPAEPEPGTWVPEPGDVLSPSVVTPEPPMVAPARPSVLHPQPVVEGTEAAAAVTPVKRGPGRPRKHPLPDPSIPKRGPGRPRKLPLEADGKQWVAKPTARSRETAKVEGGDPLEAGAPVTAKQGKPKPRKQNRGNIRKVRLTPDDTRLLQFLARYRAASTAQIARYLDRSEGAMYNRLPALAKAGLVVGIFPTARKGKVWYVTREGMAVAGMSLPIPKLKWGQLEHTLGLTDLGIGFEQQGELVLTEREIRSGARRGSLLGASARLKRAMEAQSVSGPLLGVDPEDGDAAFRAATSGLYVPIKGRTEGHIPDMVLVREPFPSGQRANIAIELERTRKWITEWEAILSAYRDTDLYSEVYYYVMGEARSGIRSVVKAVGAEDKVRVVDFTPIDRTADPTTVGMGDRRGIDEEDEDESYDELDEMAEGDE